MTECLPSVFCEMQIVAKFVGCDLNKGSLIAPASQTLFSEDSSSHSLQRNLFRETVVHLKGTTLQNYGFSCHVAQLGLDESLCVFRVIGPVGSQLEDKFDVIMILSQT